MVLPADDAGVARAAKALREGAVVVFPTETVYGVGADALDPAAVRRIFAAKGRPPDNPIIVHAEDAHAARRLAREWPPAAARLADRFWPGPLTIVLPRAREVPDVTTGGLDSVGIRVPDHPVAGRLLRAAGIPIAAPSANRSGRPSPTRVEDAKADLGDSVSVYLDAGPTRVGVESTVMSLLGTEPVLLRPGGVALEDLEAVLGPVRLGRGAEDAERPISPGTKYRHYAPSADLHVVHGDAAALLRRVRELSRDGTRVAVVASREHAPSWAHVRVPGARSDAAAWSHALFALLRDLDAEGFDAIVVEAIPEAGLGRAVMDRLRRAAAGGPSP